MEKKEELDLIENLIKDSSSKELISDGVLTLGELHSDRASLFISLVTFLKKVYTLKGENFLLWHADSEKEGFSHFGLELELDEKTKINIAGIFPELLKNTFREMGSAHLSTSKKYKPLTETLKTFNF